MRPAANFTLHAILAACLVAFAASSAAAQSPPTLRIVTETPVSAKGRNDGRMQQLQIQSWHWSSVSKVDGFTVKQGVKPLATGENVQGSQDIVITGSRIPQPNLTSASPVAGGLDAGMKQLEGQDRMGNTAVAGTLRVKVKMPWLACQEGRKYPSLELNDGNQRILIKDAVVISCGMAAARGWDPEKKEAVTGKAEPR